MRVRIAICTLAAGLAFTFGTSAQEKPQIKHVPVVPTSPASGPEMFKSYCAVCHGEKGTGNGPAAAALKTPPADLTQLSAKNGGKFPAMKVLSSIRGEAATTAHGTKDMPVWGPVFRSISRGSEAEIQQRISNLTKYIESLQAK